MLPVTQKRVLMIQCGIKKLDAKCLLVMRLLYVTYYLHNNI